MNKKIAIVGIGQTSYEAEKVGLSLDEMIFEAASKALDDAAITRDEIDNVVIAASDQADGRPISSMTLSCPAGAYLKDEIKVCDEGSYAVILACLRLLSGLFHTSLVVSWCKCSEIPLAKVTNLGLEPFFCRDLGLNHINTLSLQANSYISRYRVPEEAAVKVVVKNRTNAINNPLAHLREKVTSDEVCKSPVSCYPLRQLHLPPESDGACALVLTSQERAKSLNKKPVWINGIGWATDTYYLGERELWQLSSVTHAAKEAYRSAGIKAPSEEIDVAEIHDVSAYHELMAYEALGFCSPGDGKELIGGGTTEMTGEIPVNPSGGALASNPYFATGLVRVAEAALQVRGDAGDRQVKGVNTALAQGSYGLAVQGASVFIIGKDN